MDMKKTKKKASPASGQTQAKRWLFTLNNPDQDDPADMIQYKYVDYMIMGKETCPTTGTPHIQGYAIFKDPQRISSLKKILPRAHWEKANGTPQQNINYCSKGDQPKEEWDLYKEKGPSFGLNAVVAVYGEVPKIKRGGSTAEREERKDEVARMALDSSSVSEGMGILKRELPFDFLRFGETLERNLKRSKSQSFAPSHELASFNKAPLIFEKKSMLLWGPSNTGKTSYALAHFKTPLLVSHIDVLKQLSPDNDGIVFDDMAFKHWPPEAVIHLLDFDLPRDINVRYGTVNIPKNVYKIFTHNTDNPFYNDEIDIEQKKAIERRLNRVHVLKQLY